MNFIRIILLLHIVRSSFADENESEDIASIDAPGKSANPDEDVEHIEPEAAVRDALSESELVKSANPRDGYLDSASLKAIDEATDAGSPLDGVVRSADNDARTALEDTENEPVAEAREGSIDTEKPAVRAADDLKSAEPSPNVKDDSLRAARDDESATSDAVSVRSAAPEDLALSTRRMNDHVLDTKARSGNLDAPMPQAQTFKPLDIPTFARLNASFIRPVFKPYFSLPLNFPNPRLPPPDQKPLLLDSNELTNQFQRFNSYPARERFQSPYQLQPITSTFAPIEKSLNTLILKATEVPPLIFNQNILQRPYFPQPFPTPLAQQKYFLPSFNSP